MICFQNWQRINDYFSYIFLCFMFLYQWTVILSVFISLRKWNPLLLLLLFNCDILKSEDVELNKELRKELLEFAVGRVHLKGVFNQWQTFSDKNLDKGSNMGFLLPTSHYIIFNLRIKIKGFHFRLTIISKGPSLKLV